jgi:hypothetical protein
MGSEGMILFGEGRWWWLWISLLDRRCGGVGGGSAARRAGGERWVTFGSDERDALSPSSLGAKGSMSSP